MCSWMRCFVVRGVDELVWDLQRAYSAQIIGREALHYLIQCMHEYGHKNRIGSTYRVWLQNLETTESATRNRNRGYRSTSRRRIPPKGRRSVQLVKLADCLPIE